MSSGFSCLFTVCECDINYVSTFHIPVVLKVFIQDSVPFLSKIKGTKDISFIYIMVIAIYYIQKILKIKKITIYQFIFKNNKSIIHEQK